MNVLTVPLNVSNFRFEKNNIDPLFFENTYTSAHSMFEEIERKLNDFQRIKDIIYFRKIFKIIFFILLIGYIVVWICVIASCVDTDKPNIGLIVGVLFGGFFFVFIFAGFSQCLINNKINETQKSYSESINEILNYYNIDIFSTIRIQSLLEIMLNVPQNHQEANENMYLNIIFNKNYGGGNNQFFQQNNNFPGQYDYPQQQQGVGYNQGIGYNQEFDYNQKFGYNQSSPNQGFSNTNNNYDNNNNGMKQNNEDGAASYNDYKGKF